MAEYIFFGALLLAGIIVAMLLFRKKNSSNKITEGEDTPHYSFGELFRKLDNDDD